MQPENQFVFVVCGAKEHIDTLNFSLLHLRFFSKNKIVVLTDLKRNGEIINHDNIVNISTPENLSNHQASIYLKTSAHRFLEHGKNYCYLDTDVVALSNEVDNIFNFQHRQIIFATDHCKMREFSSHAVNCGCFEKKKKAALQLEKALEEYDLNKRITDPELKEKGKKLLKKFTSMKQKRIDYAVVVLRYYLSHRIFKLDENTFFNKKKRWWNDADGNVILYSMDNFIENVENASGLKRDEKHDAWRTKDGDNVYDSECNHLKLSIKKIFNIDIDQQNFQHWNGGVFLFNDNSHKFLDAWHNKTMTIFNDPYWKTRDQGTLIATAWEFGIQEQETLPVEFNFIADYNHPTMIYKGNLTFDINDKRKNIKPCFIHIYHHWGDKDWNVWQDIESMKVD